MIRSNEKVVGRSYSRCFVEVDGWRTSDKSHRFENLQLSEERWAFSSHTMLPVGSLEWSRKFEKFQEAPPLTIRFYANSQSAMSFWKFPAIRFGQSAMSYPKSLNSPNEHTNKGLCLQFMFSVFMYWLINSYGKLINVYSRVKQISHSTIEGVKSPRESCNSHLFQNEWKNMLL